MNQYGPPAATDSRTLGRRRRAKRAFAANYIHELSDRRNRTADRRQQPRTNNLVEQPQGG